MVARTSSETVFACYSSACRPPTSGGTGGSSSSKGKGIGGTYSPGRSKGGGELRSFPTSDGKPLGDAWGWGNPMKREYGHGLTGRHTGTIKKSAGKYVATLVEHTKSGTPALRARSVQSSHRAAQDYLDKQANASIQYRRTTRN
jgi:hypothetical protein